MKVLKTMFRAFILGLGIGVLVAPRAGAETRRLLSEKFDQLLDGVNSLTDKLDQSSSDSGTTSAGSATSAYVPQQHSTVGTAAQEVGSTDPLTAS